MAEPLRLVYKANDFDSEQEMLLELRRLLTERQKLGSIVSAVSVFAGYCVQFAKAPNRQARLESIALRLQQEAFELKDDIRVRGNKRTDTLVTIALWVCIIIFIGASFWPLLKVTVFKGLGS